MNALLRVCVGEQQPHTVTCGAPRSLFEPKPPLGHDVLRCGDRCMLCVCVCVGAGFVVLHGAGSYGHFEASRYAITKPDTPQPLLLEGFAHTRRAVMRLNQLVVNELIEAGVPAVGLSPFGFCHTRSGSLDPASEQAYVDAVQAALNRWGTAQHRQHAHRRTATTHHH